MKNAKEKALVALMTTRTAKEAAERAGVGYRTLRRWINEDPEFQAEYRALTDNAFDDATRRLAQLNEKAIDLLEEMIDQRSDKAHQAAKSILEYSTKYQEMNDIIRRIEALEAEADARNR